MNFYASFLFLYDKLVSIYQFIKGVSSFSLKQGLQTKIPYDKIIFVKICICTSLRCRMNGSETLLSQAEKECKGSSIKVESCGCLGGCQYGPNLETINQKGEREKQFTIFPSFLSQLIQKLKQPNNYE